jgi:hypothetical protein
MVCVSVGLGDADLVAFALGMSPKRQQLGPPVANWNRQIFHDHCVRVVLEDEADFAVDVNLGVWVVHVSFLVGGDGRGGAPPLHGS